MKMKEYIIELKTLQLQQYSSFKTAVIEQQLWFTFSNTRGSSGMENITFFMNIYELDHKISAIYKLIKSTNIINTFNLDNCGKISISSK